MTIEQGRRAEFDMNGSDILVFLQKMDTSAPSLLIFFMFLSLSHSITIARAQFCESTSCGSEGVSIEYPFWLRGGGNESSLNCGYPGFELSCNIMNQTLLTLPKTGDFVVNKISLEDQKIYVNDPEGCLPRRIIRGFNFENSPFQFADIYRLENFSFFNCSPNVTVQYEIPLHPTSCLGKDENYSVIAIPTGFDGPWTSLCQIISSALVPVEHEYTRPSLASTDYYGDIQLQWYNPNCTTCVEHGGSCGFSDTSFGITCNNLPSRGQGTSRKAKIAITLGLGIPGFLCVIWLACIFCRKIKTRAERREVSTEVSTFIIPHTPILMMGLDESTIEKYPKTQIGESGRLPKPNDNICAICLFEYQPKDTLRTIPDCNHYYHATCIDGWLKMNATCPLCRKLPQRPFFHTTSLSLSSNSV